MCICLTAGQLAAQETINYGTISGRVTDPQGAVVPGAYVSARQTDTNLTRETVTDEDGRFRFPYLRVGRYEIAIRMSGFADATRAVTVTVGSAFELPVTLALAGVAANVDVVGESTVLEAARSQIAGTVSQAEVDALPMNGRNFLDLALLIPGVSPTNIGSTQLFAETSAVPGQGISIGSQRNFSNNFIVDGLSANDDAAGLSGIPYGVDAVDQFQVVTSGGQAELGRALGGYISVVTKSGTNTTRGDLYGYFRDDSLNATNALLVDGGGRKLADEPEAIRREPRRTDCAQSYVLLLECRAANGSTRPAWRSLRRPTSTSSTPGLRLSGIPDRRSRPACIRIPSTPTHFLAKVDHQVNSRDQFTHPLQPLRRVVAATHEAPARSMLQPRRRDSITSTNRWRSATR